MVIKSDVRCAIFVFSFVLCFGDALLAQPNFKDGYVISNNDTTYGKIDYQNWRETPQEIFFVARGKDEVRELSAQDISEFYVLGEFYKSAEITIDKNPRRVHTQRVFTSEYKEPKMATVFIQTLVKGEALSLYMHKEERENFYLKNDLSYTELISHEFSVERNGRYAINSKNVNLYVQQLNSLNIGCESVFEKKRIHYKRNSLIDLVVSCNEYLSTKEPYVYESPSLALSHGIVLRTGINNFEVELPGGKTNYTSKKLFSFGYSADITLPRGRGEKKISTQVLFSSFEAKNNEVYVATIKGGSCNNSGGISGSGCRRSSDFLLEESTIKISYLKLNVIYSNRFVSNDISPTFLIGGSLGKAIYNNSESRFTTKVYFEESGERNLQEVITGTKEVYEPSDFAVTIFAGLGVSYKKHTVSLLYEPRLGELSVVPTQSFYLNIKAVLF